MINIYRVSTFQGKEVYGRDYISCYEGKEG